MSTITASTSMANKIGAPASTTTTTTAAANSNKNGVATPGTNGTVVVGVQQQQQPLQLPPMGMARVKSVLSGDTVILVGNSKPNHPNPPEVMFTFESIIAPR